MPDQTRGQIGKVFVVLRSVVDGTDSAARLQEFVKQQIAPYKYPRAITFLPALPRTMTGKLQRLSCARPGAR